MPIYEYRCNKCGHQFERIQKFSDPPLTDCERCDGKLTKVIAAPALQFKGTGWYVTDYSDKGKVSKNDGESSTKKKEKPSSDSAASPAKKTKES